MAPLKPYDAPFHERNWNEYVLQHLEFGSINLLWMIDVSSRFLLKAVAKRAEGKAKARAKPEAKAKVSVESWVNLDWICSKLNMFPHNVLQRFMIIHARIAQTSNSQRPKNPAAAGTFFRVCWWCVTWYWFPYVSTLNIIMTCFCSNIALIQ